MLIPQNMLKPQSTTPTLSPPSVNWHARRQLPLSTSSTGPRTLVTNHEPLLAMAPALHASTTMLAARAQLPRASTSASSAALRNLVQMQMQQRGYATPNGPPPQNFRTSKRVEWAWEKDNTLDRLGKYFLLSEMGRGMYLLMEQFFRPPYVFSD